MNTPHPYPFITDFRAAGLGVLRDDSEGGGRAVLVAPAECVTQEHLNRILTISGGLPFVALSSTRAAAFMLSSMSRPRTTYAASGGPAEPLQMCVSVDAREGITTGISISDRIIAINILGEAVPNPRKLVRPGHVFPVETSDGGVLVRNALPEGALDIIRISGSRDAALFVDLLDGEGALLKPEQQAALCAAAGIPCTTLSELTQHRLQSERLVYRVAEARLPTLWTGEMRSYIYRSMLHAGEHLALVKGEIKPDRPVLTRVQMEVTSADVFGGDSPPTRAQIRTCLEAIGRRECGVLLYLRRPVEGCLREQIMAHQADAAAFKPVIQLREYGLGAQILYDLGVRQIELLTNTKSDLTGLKAFGLEIVSHKSITSTAC
jgi:3,4-dihydroxy 2-butanone 4-phosphate synthase / GTP cyclohydrolase II